MNRLILAPPVIEGNKITYSYEIEGFWKDAFHANAPFFVEYSTDVSGVPEGLAVVPFLVDVLPIAWIYDAELIVPCIDKAFYESIPAFKHGYEEMYPSVRFMGKVTAETIEENIPEKQGRCAALFSGGADAFNTLVMHAEEKPDLITLWGADITLDDRDGWDRVEAHLKQTADAFGVESLTVKTSFRSLPNETLLHHMSSKMVGDGWWHGFQHGIAIIGHAAPLAYVNGYSTVYIASSFTAAEKGKVTCASDPTIDNFVRFGTTRVVHDGYEFDRQGKIHNIISYARKTGIAAQLRVCWVSSGGKNCCACEKCWRTILELAAEGEDPKKYGMSYTEAQARAARKLCRDPGNIPLYRRNSVYKTAQDTMHRNCRREDVPASLRWFYDIPITEIGKVTVSKRIKKFAKKAYAKVKRTLKRQTAAHDLMKKHLAYLATLPEDR